MIVFLLLCVGFAVVGLMWLYQIAQGRQRHKPNKKLTDALEKLRLQGKGAALKDHKKDKKDGK